MKDDDDGGVSAPDDGTELKAAGSERVLSDVKSRVIGDSGLR